MSKKNYFRDTWKDYFDFPKRERKGLYVLFILIVIEIGVLLYIKYKPTTNHPEDISQFKNEIDKFYASAKLDTTKNHYSHAYEIKHSDSLKTKSEERQPAELFTFNPNNLPEGDWKRLGFSDKQVHVIKNYELKGGKFYSKEDVKKMYCISEKQYARIVHYISIPPTEHGFKHDTLARKFEKPVLMIDVGTADTLELMKLPGIGPSYARRIYNYRERLGGFYSLNQLKEVWGFSDSLFQIIAPHIALRDTENIKRININAADYKEFRQLPYVDKNLANVLVNYRKQHGDFKALEEIRKVPLVNDELYSKLAHYFTVRN